MPHFSMLLGGRLISVIPNASWELRWPTIEDLFISAIGTIDADKVQVLEMALGRLPADDATTGRLCWPPFVLNLHAAFARYAVRLWPTGPLAIAESPHADEGTIVRVLNNVLCPAHGADRFSSRLQARTVDALVRAERIGDPVLTFWAAMGHSARLPACAGDIREVDRCIEIHGSMAQKGSTNRSSTGVHKLWTSASVR